MIYIELQRLPQNFNLAFGHKKSKSKNMLKFEPPPVEVINFLQNGVYQTFQVQELNSKCCGQLCPSRGICALHSSKPVPRCTAVKAEGGGLLTEGSEVKAPWTDYFELLYQAYPPTVELDARGVTIPIVDPPFNCGPSSFVETQAAVNWLKWG